MEIVPAAAGAIAAAGAAVSFKTDYCRHGVYNKFYRIIQSVLKCADIGDIINVLIQGFYPVRIIQTGVYEFKAERVDSVVSKPFLEPQDIIF